MKSWKPYLGSSLQRSNEELKQWVTQYFFTQLVQFCIQCKTSIWKYLVWDEQNFCYFVLEWTTSGWSCTSSWWLYHCKRSFLRFPTKGNQFWWITSGNSGNSFVPRDLPEKYTLNLWFNFCHVPLPRVPSSDGERARGGGGAMKTLKVNFDLLL